MMSLFGPCPRYKESLSKNFRLQLPTYLTIKGGSILGEKIYKTRKNSFPRHQNLQMFFRFGNTTSVYPIYLQNLSSNLIITANTYTKKAAILQSVTFAAITLPFWYHLISLKLKSVSHVHIIQWTIATPPKIDNTS